MALIAVNLFPGIPQEAWSTLGGQVRGMFLSRHFRNGEIQRRKEPPVMRTTSISPA
jgi:hypothetical protein